MQQQNVIVRLGQSIEVQLKMEVGGVAETIEVTASSPTVDTRSTTVGAVLDSEMLKNVPVGRRFSDALYLAPGVTSSGSAGSANPSMARRQRPRQPVRRRRREHHQHRLRRARLLLDHLRLARQRHAVRLHQGSPGEDRRLRSRVRPGHRRRRQRRDQERHEQAPAAAPSATRARRAPRATGSSTSRRTAPCRRSARTSATWA